MSVTYVLTRVPYRAWTNSKKVMPCGSSRRSVGPTHAKISSGMMQEIAYPRTAIGPPRMAASGTVKRTHAPAPEAKKDIMREKAPCEFRADMYWLRTPGARATA